MLASCPASMVNQKPADLGIPNRFSLTASRFSAARTSASLIDCPLAAFHRLVVTPSKPEIAARWTH